MPSRRLAFLIGNAVATAFLVYANLIDYQMGLSFKGVHFLQASMMALVKQNMLLTNYADASDSKDGKGMSA